MMEVIQGRCLKCDQSQIWVLRAISRYTIDYCLPCIQKEFAKKEYDGDL
ncbi:MAG: hypothetical protein MRERV_21c009 [Mycoplasmataceae bacterium RV_VA103A]|nr:MAG: hypothetical protein MRERV_21c009 [Mycoplasmataceae bacterium RV_VA103A]